MAHQHTVSDTDKHFTINPETREIINESGKITLIQNDHNSERFTFDIPMLVDGHDMSKCNVVQVHYLNVEGVKDGMTYEGLYEIDDLQANGDTVSGSWLISRNATQFAGQLNFVIHYQCVADDGTVDYAWSTAIHTGIVVSDGIQNNEVAVSQYTDVLEQWRKTLVLANVIKQYTPADARAELEVTTTEKTTITIPANGWVNNQQTVTVNLVTADNVVFVSPAPESENFSAYSENGIRCVAQSDGALTFACENAPSIAVTVNIVILA